MFIGEYKHSLDEKGRVIVPAKYREKLGDNFILTKGLDGCLFIYPLSEWMLFEQKLKQLPLTNTQARKFVRFFLSGAIECNSDKQGRILIPNNLRVYSEIEKDIVFIGMSTRIEIWSIDKWDNYNEEEFNAETIAEQMEELGI
ncbi:division/cell wall cluster transcriptional repressor MraZ [Cellulosilyticum sp. I15G10I2]|uniref:division/cell wall cluster transcriptional repressor MraZ n=1 Tax=Cellulosilyticum sp. I15G10I2 TaxID=1892843 RepID=UPI00085C9612|nr:division/cell wall cluster transcriptional repressor MraZ [Cellulosilyticum sp. I15G10I2]